MPFYTKLWTSLSPNIILFEKEEATVDEDERKGERKKERERGERERERERQEYKKMTPSDKQRTLQNLFVGLTFPCCLNRLLL